MSSRGLARWGLWSAYPARTRPTSARERWLPAASFAAVVVAGWWAVSWLSLVPARLLPAPGAVLGRVYGWAAEGVIWRYLLPTVGAAVLGALLAVLVAVPLGVLAAHSRLLASVVEPFVAFSQTVPLVAVAPLLVLWIGYGTLPIALLAAVIAFFPMITTTVIGLRSLDMRMVEEAWLDGSSAWQRLVQVEFPVAAPAILAGIRAGVVLAMTGAIVGEFVMGGSGLGTLLSISREAVDTVGVFAVLVWICLAAFGLQGLVRIAERASVRRLQGEQS